MAIKKYTASKDTTITNAYKSNLKTKATDANMGASDTMEIFSLYAQGVPPLDENGDFQRDDEGNIINTVEKSRILIQFPVSDISSARAQKVIPPAGSVDFKLKLYNAVHGFTLPTSFTINVFPAAKAWTEGVGLDMEEYADKGASGGGKGADWVNSDESTEWDSEGGDYVAEGYTKTATFEKGTEDIDIDITDVVEAWIRDEAPLANYGFILMLEPDAENCTTRESYYTKKFFARGTEYFFKKPVIEASWDSSTKDDRGLFYRKSNLRGEEDNTNTIYLKNLVSGTEKDIEGVDEENEMTIKIYSDSAKEQEVNPENLSVTNPSDGVYMASFVLDLDTDFDTVYIDWQDADDEIYHSESVSVLTRAVASETLPVYVTNITNMKSVYSSDETARFKLYCRLKDWNPTIYTKASKEIESSVIEKAYFRIVRVVDEEIVIDYGEHTSLSYDENGNYFDLDMELLETNFAYRIELQYEIEGNPQQQPETFKFRVE